MESFVTRSGEDCVPAVVVSESSVGRLPCLQEIVAAQEEFVLIRCPGTLAQLVACCRRFEHCILILEGSHLRDADRLVIADLVGSGRSIRVLVRIDDDTSMHEDLLLLGCFGFLANHTTLQTLRNILKTVRSGEMWVQRKLISRVFQRVLLSQSSNRLSRRECEILAMIARGLRNKSIAEQMFISQETLRWHLRNLYAKTRIRGRDKLVEYANEFSDARRFAAFEPRPTIDKERGNRKSIAAVRLTKTSLTSALLAEG